MKKQHVSLSDLDWKYLKRLISQGELPVKVYRRALSLLELDRGQSYTAVARMVGVSHQTVSTLSRTYQGEGLSCLHDKPRSGRPIEIDGEQRAKVTALACSQAPVGYERWSLRLLAEKAVELGYCEHLSHSTAGDILKKTKSSPI